jgi:uncharacterized protein
MQLSEMQFDGAQPIEGYGPGFFRIGGQALDAPVLITATGAQGWGGYEDIRTLTALSGEIDVLFIGTGAETTHVPQEFRDNLEAAGLGVEAMSSPAACRTYNVLLSEGRRIAVALLSV